MAKEVKRVYKNFKLGEMYTLADSMEVLKELLNIQNYDEVKNEIENIIQEAKDKEEELIKDEAFINKELNDEIDKMKASKKIETKEIKERYDRLQVEIESKYDDRYEEFDEKTKDYIEGYKNRVMEAIKKSNKKETE